LGVFNYTDGDVVADLARKTGDILRCHNLVWHNQLAPWGTFPSPSHSQNLLTRKSVTEDTWSVENLTSALIQHVTEEARHWAGQCYAWDVLNETLNEDGTYQNDTFLQVLGPDYIKIAFRAAAAADPWAKLYYNDYNIEYPGPKATAAQENIVKFLQADGIRIDGVGLQSHFIVGETPSLSTQVENMEAFTALGVEVAVTEV
jgi:endo-1,4-beta-xylanase